MRSLDILGNNIGEEQANSFIQVLDARDTLTTLCGLTGTETELDLSNRGLSASCAILVANEIKVNSALNSVNILGNSIGEEQANNLINLLNANGTLKTLCGFTGTETELDLSNRNLTASCAILVANEVKVNRCVSSITFGGDEEPESNYIHKTEVKGWSFNIDDRVIYEGRECRVSQQVNSEGRLRVKCYYPPAKLTADMTEADLSGLGLGAGGVTIAAAFLPRMG